MPNLRVRCDPDEDTHALRLDVFMARANAAYYDSHDPFADFTTSPEISQIFGEILGAWAAIVWRQLGAPAPVHLVEAGPGRGTLMQDMLRATARVAPDFAASARVHFIETSRRLRAEQAARVAPAQWHDDLQTVPQGPAIFLANEFLDALPIRQFTRTRGGWEEHFVRDGAWVRRPCQGPDRQAAEGDIVETCEAATQWSQNLADRLASQGGVALILDYGTTQSLPGDSLQALRGGRPADPLTEPGSADLTAHVDFAAIAAAARQSGATTWGPLAQGDFLTRVGFWDRARALAAANPALAAAIGDAATRLASPARMGALFKVLCITSPGAVAPPGFES
jgi:SAM-dependent MidA family methyltransferase